MTSSPDPREPSADPELEGLRRTVARLADLERRLRTELETEREAHEGDVKRLEAEIEAQGARLAESTRLTRELRTQLATLRAQRGRAIRHRIARLPGVARLRSGGGRRPPAAGADPHSDPRRR